MLIYYFTDIDAAFGLAEPRLLGSLPVLDGLAEGAYRDGEARRARLGVEVTKVQAPAFVRLTVGTPTKGPGRLTVPLSWTAEGSTALFPKMDADLMLATARSRCQPALAARFVHTADGRGRTGTRSHADAPGRRVERQGLRRPHRRLDQCRGHAGRMILTAVP